MRRVNIKTGLKQRINEILGTDFGSESSTGAYEITPWSIQAAMLSNLKRIGTGIVGEASQGRVMKGLSISYYSPGANIKITQGYGFTPEGNVVTLGKDLIVQITQTSGYVYVYLKYILDVAVEDSEHTYGKNTAFNSETGTKEIVYDDKALILGSSITRDIIEVSTDEKSGEDGYIYLGKIYLDGVLDSESVITNTIDIGFVPNFYNEYLESKSKIDELYDTNNLSNITSVIATQLIEIGSTTISAAQWILLSTMQDVSVSNNVTFGTIIGTSLDAGSGSISGGTLYGTSLDVGSGAIDGGAITGDSLIVDGIDIFPSDKGADITPVQKGSTGKYYIDITNDKDYYEITNCTNLICWIKSTGISVGKKITVAMVDYSTNASAVNYGSGEAEAPAGYAMIINSAGIGMYISTTYGSCVSFIFTGSVWRMLS